MIANVDAATGNESITAFLTAVGLNPAEVVDDSLRIEVGLDELVVTARVFRSAPLAALAILGDAR